MKPKDLSIVIVTFKSESNIFNCLNSIPSDHDVIVVENSNNLNFKSDIEKKYVNVKCFLTGTNKGYAIANNIGLKNVKTKYALVLNPDTIVEKNAIENFLITADKFKDFWLIGPANDQSVNYEFQEKKVKEVDNLKGFAIFFNLSKFNSNFFDENFFLYFEEIDLCKNVKKNNGKIYLDKNITISHEGGSSVDKSNSLELEKNRNWHWMWSTFYFNKKYRGFLLAFIFIFPKLISSILKTIFYQLIFNKDKKIIYFYRLSGILNSILGKKSWYRPSLD